MFSKYRGSWALFILCFLAGSVLLDTWLLNRPFNFHLTFEMAANGPDSAQLFYNTGSGYTQADSATTHVNSSALSDFKKVSFALPSKTIHQFRFDPAGSPGTFLLRGLFLIDGNGKREPLNARQVKAFHQVAQIRTEGTTIRIVTEPGAQDPGIEIELNQPIRVGQRHLSQEALFALGLHVCLGAWLFAIWRLRRGLLHFMTLQLERIKAVDLRLRELGERLSNADFILFDAFAIRVYLTFILCFTGSVAADLNGSSTDMLNQIYKRGSAETPLLGEPRAIRSDEWGYSTPNVLSQALRARQFEVETSNFGPHSVALIGNVPVWHLTTLFRPQFWGFFLLPVDYGYAFFWQSKAFILLVGTFTWLLLMTRSSQWSLTGALWFFFSPCTQWIYSWPPGLPEMVGLSCLACVAFAYLTVGRNRIGLLAAALVATGCSVDFALCSYLPHMIPLLWMQVAVFIGWCSVSRTAILQRSARVERAAAFLLSLCVIGILGLIVFRDVRTTALAVSNTVYPGRRVLAGGTMAPLAFAAQLLPWGQSEYRVPTFLGNICEGSGFLWLAPMTLFLLNKVSFCGLRKAMFIALSAFSLALLAWMTLPLPAAVGGVFGLNRTFGSRCVPALGLANIALVSVCLANVRLIALRRVNFKALLGVGVVGTAVLTLAFIAVNGHMDQFFSLTEIIGGSTFLGLLIALMTSSRLKVLPFVLVGSQALFFGAVNPVQQGVRVFTSSALYRFVHSKPSYTRDQWLLYSEQPYLSGFFAGVGCQVYTGEHYVPDITHFPLFASRGLDPNAYNRLGFRIAVLPDADKQTKLRLINLYVAEWKVDPADPMLPQIGIRYLAFDRVTEPPPEITSKLIPLTDHAIDGFWLYQLP